MNYIEHEVAIVVPSCDAYSDVWPPLFQALDKFWPAGTFPRYLVTNLLEPCFQHVKNIQVGKDVSWSDNLLLALKRIPESYVLLNIDDLILCKPVDHSATIAMISQFVSSKGNYLRLNPTPSGNGRGLIGEVFPGEIYRASTVFSIWRKEVLQSVLQQGESAWQFEIQGSLRTDIFNKWFASRVTMIGYVNLVIKGKVDTRALAVLRRCGISYNSKRATLSFTELMMRQLIEIRSQAFAIIPRRLARRIRNRFQSS